MIGRLRGRVAADEVSGIVLIDVGGVGYEVTTPAGVLGRARRHGEDEVELIVHTHVREDALELFGFASDHERRVFRLLIGVPNVGPRTALGVLSALPIVVDDHPMSIDKMESARALAVQLCGDGRVLLQGEAFPQVGDLAANLDAMAQLATAHRIVPLAYVELSGAVYRSTKYIRNAASYTLFDLATDPGERRNLAGTRSELLDQMVTVAEAESARRERAAREAGGGAAQKARGRKAKEAGDGPRAPKTKKRRGDKEERPNVE